MKNLARAVRLSLKFRFTIVGIVLSSLVVAAFWGANVAAIYPFVEAAFKGDSMHDWVDRQIQVTEQNAREFAAKVEQLQRQQAAAAQGAAAVDGEISYWQARLEAEQQALLAVKRIEPYIRRYLPSDPFRTLVFIVAAITASTVIKGVFLTISLVLVARLGHQTTMRMRKLCYRRTLEMDLSAFEQGRTGDLMSRFTGDVNAITQAIRTLYGKTLMEPLKMAACVAGAAYISWRLLLFSMIVTPLPFALMYFLARSIKRANRRVMEEVALFYNRLSQTFTAVQVVKAFTMERWERGRLRGKLLELYRKLMRVALYNSLTRVNTEVLGVGVICLAILAGGYLVLNQETHLLGLRMTDRPLSFGALVVFYGFLIGTSDPARKLSDVINNLQAGAAAADRVYEVLDRQPLICDPAKPRRLPQGRRELSFAAVQFHYVPEEPVLRDINLKIPFGETLAVVGPNGCGKSTLAKLILRFYDPVQGAVSLGGVDIRQLRLRELRGQIGVVTQQTQLFDDTVLNNIRYGSPHASQAEVIRAAQRAHAHHFIEEILEHGYDTNLGEAGGRLSGGQRQRIALARAILRDPPLLILDEATSQVDLESEQLTHRALREFKVGRTMLVITHRLTTLELADRILVMDEGRILDVGRHEELRGRCELYQRLCHLGLKKTA